MAVTFGFYNSLSGDRVYDARQFSSMFDGIITDGVFELLGDSFFVAESSGMDIVVGTGRAWLNRTWTLNDSGLVLTVPESDLTNPRIDTVILEVDESSAVRANSIKILAGTPGVTPVPADRTNTSELHQYAIAYITVGSGVSSIVQANIENVVGTFELPYVTVPQAGGTSGGGAAVLETQVFS